MAGSIRGANGAMPGRGLPGAFSWENSLRPFGRTDDLSWSELFEPDPVREFEEIYWKKLNEPSITLENTPESGKMKLGNRDVRRWYVDNVEMIPNCIDIALSLEEQARQAYEARNILRTKARNMMADEEARKLLDEKRPNKSFEELVRSKMERKGMTREEAVQDVYRTATKTNKEVNKESGIGGE